MARTFPVHTPIAMLTLTALVALQPGCFPRDDGGIEDDGPATDAPSQAAVVAALPDADRMQVNLPTGLPASYTGDLGDTSDYYLFTHDVTDDINHFVGEVLDTIGDIVSYDGDWIGPYTVAWGPLEYHALDPVLTYFVMTWNEDDSYTWYLYEFPRHGDPEVDGVVEAAGEIAPGANASESSGGFYIDYTLRQQMDPTREVSGQVYVEYLLEPGVGAVEAWFDDIVAYPGDDPTDAYYAYATVVGGAGAMLFGFVADLNGNGTDEVMAVHSRWQADGAGRADSTVTEGDLGETQAHVSECWDDLFLTVYHADDAGWEPVIGDEADCAFNPGEHPDLSAVEL